MKSLSLRLVGLITLFLINEHSADGQVTRPRTDRYGDMLPEGAIARLGTLRLTHLGGIEAVAISPDGTVAASGVRDGKATYLGTRTVHQTKGFTLGEGVHITESTIRLWSVKTGELLRQITTPDAPVSHIRFAPDGKTFFAGCGKFLCCWESATGKKIWEQEAITGGRFHYGVHLQEIIQAGETLASLHQGRIICPVQVDGGVSYHYHRQLAVRFWNARTGAALPLVKALQSTISAEMRVPVFLHEIALTPDLKRAAIAVSEGDPLPRLASAFPRDDIWKYPKSRVELIDLAGGKMLLSIANPDGEFGRLAISDDGSKVATQTGKTIATPFEENGASGVSIDTRKDLWWASAQKQEKRLLAKNLGQLPKLAFVGKDRLAANDSESKVTVWRLDTGARIDEHDVRPETFHPACAAGVAVQSAQNTILLTDLKSRKPLHAFEGHRFAPSLRFAIHANDTLISRDHERALFWDSRSWKQTRVVALPKNGDRYFRWFGDCDAEFDHELSIEKGLYLHKEEKRNLELREITSSKAVRSIGDKIDRYSWYFAPAGNRFFCEEDDSFQFFDVATGKRLAKSEGDPGHMGYMWYRHPEFSTYGQLFATATEGPAIELYDVATGKLLRKLAPNLKNPAADSGRSGRILKFKFSPDEQLAFGEVHELSNRERGFSSERVSICIWNLKTGEVVQDMVLEPAIYVFWRETLSRSLAGVMAMSHDQRLVALARVHGQRWERRFECTPIEIWEVASGTKRGELIGHGPIADLSFSPDGRCLASSSDDTTILIWDLHCSLQSLKRKARLTEEELNDCWRTLFERNAVKADAAMRNLIDSPGDSLPYLQKKLHPLPAPDAARVRSLIAELDSDAFKIRNRANDELAKFGELILTQIEEAIKATDKLESKSRLESLARKARTSSQPFGSMARIGEWRALEVLEKIGSPQALTIVRDLAGGAPDGQLTIAAKTVGRRLETRKK